MSFRDSFVQDDADNGSSRQSRDYHPREFHPIRDLIDGMRESFRARVEQRQQARMERGEQRNYRPAQDDRYANRNQRPTESYPQQTNDRRASVPVKPIPTNIGTRGRVEYVSTRTNNPAPRYDQPLGQTEEPPLANPKEGPAEKEDLKIAETPPITEQVFPQTISIKEKSGAVAEVAEEKNASPDKRLNSYLSERGPELVELDVNGSGISDKGLGLLKMAPNLAKLKLNDCEVDNESMKVLGQQGLKNLKDLNLHSTRVGDEGVAQLKDMPIVNLNLSDTTVTDEGMQHLKQIKTLQSLNLDYGMVGNEGIKAFKDMPSLRSVSLKGTSLNDDAIADLSKAQQLMVLNLEDTKMSPAGVAKLQQAMPRTVITAPDLVGPANAAQGRHHDRKERQEQQRPVKWFRSPFVVPHRS